MGGREGDLREREREREREEKEEVWKVSEWKSMFFEFGSTNGYPSDLIPPAAD